MVKTEDLLGLEEFTRWLARYDFRKVADEFWLDRPRTVAQMQHLRERLQSAKRRAGGIGGPYRSYDDMMLWMRAGIQKERGAGSQRSR